MIGMSDPTVEYIPGRRWLIAIGTVLITYFKQVSEGFDDREKFQIMQKVGLDKEMIQESTRSQIVWMFFLPIGIATIHVIFAYPIVRKLLLIFGVTNETTWLLSFVGVVIAWVRSAGHEWHEVEQRPHDDAHGH